jgi:hypothetical protein
VITVVTSITDKFTYKPIFNLNPNPKNINPITPIKINFR